MAPDASTPPSRPAAGPGRPYAMHLFVCTSGTDCPRDGPVDEIRAALKREVKERGLAASVRVNQSGCLNQCGHGPMMVVYPDGVWYGHLDVEKARRVLAAHMAGTPGVVEALRFRLGPGANKAPPDATGRRVCSGECTR